MRWIHAVVIAAAIAGVPAVAQIQDPIESTGAQRPESAQTTEEQKSKINVAPVTVAPRAQTIKTGGKYDVSKIGNRGIGRGLNLYSIEREQQMGKELAADVERQVRLVSDPVITEYVNRVGQNIVRNSDAQVPFVIKVIDDDQVNAFALPGGYFYVNSGLILATENEAELAGVMAHEIAHVAARHATKTQTKVQIMNMVSIPLIFVGGPAGFAVRQAMGLAVPMGFLKFTRDEEREADLLGVQYEYAAGYDPTEFVHFFETLKAREDKEKHGRGFFIAKAFATHPMTNDRIKRAQHEILTMLPPKEQYIVTTSEFDTVKARLAGIQNRNKIEVGDPERPTLRRRQASHNDGAGQSQTDEQNRPTLKRK